MVFIHGGGFSIGFALAFDSVNRYMDHDIVVVVIQYRLGPLGNSFLIEVLVLKILCDITL